MVDRAVSGTCNCPARHGPHVGRRGAERCVQSRRSSAAISEGRHEREGRALTGPALDVRELRVWYATEGDPVRAVDGVSLRVFPGAMVGLVGESGCGKSTLGRSILSLLPTEAAVSGEVNIKGRNIVGLSPRDLRRIRGPGVGLIFQEPMTRLNPLMRIIDQMKEVLKTHESSLSREEVRRRSREALAMVGIAPSRLRQYPDEILGWDAAADNDRAGNRATSRCSRSRRTHHRPRCNRRS